ncbi:MAG: NifX-associated nitrogen fixation protein [Cyanobacteria bacterium SID2]|nr:NifX-associated nitrogen fixation protein [Cyanobacteria bacterium SID2]MBP0006480.1 NifX-associated nitrogen fixation protein [Cyanobacteria bacterium SBC]
MAVSNSTTEEHSAIETPFIKELIRQIRVQDAYGVYRKLDDEKLLKPFVRDREEKRKISLEEDIDPATQGRIILFYRAIATCIEQETGLISQVVVDLNTEGFGWALVFSGRLLLVVRTLRDAQRFGYATLEKLASEGQTLVDKGVDLARSHGEVGQL